MKNLIIMLGPYRNLTTVTVSTISLHPEVMILNHGVEKVLGKEEIDFFTGDFSHEKVENFKQLILDTSENKSYNNHAFKVERMKKTFNKRYKKGKDYSAIKTLLWKETMRITNILSANKSKMQEILDERPDVKFLLPIRNPIDCTMSNANGMWKYLVGGVEGTFFNEQVSIFDNPSLSANRRYLNIILESHAWFINLMGNYPDRFMCFFENEMTNEGTLDQICDFMNIRHSAEWKDDVRKVWVMKGPYKCGEGLKEYYKEKVSERFFHPYVDKFNKFLS